MSVFTTPRLDRRTLLAGIGGTALLGGLSACGGGSDDKGNSTGANQAAKLPTYVPFQSAKPDFPGTAAGVEPAYKLFPRQNPVSVPDKPGNGSDKVTGLVISYAALAPGPDRNSYWKGLNERLGIDLALQMTPFADYPQKFATVIAGNELPDMILTQPVTNFPSLLEKRFAPLDEYLAGDAVKDYPNLANIPTQTWKSTIYNGKIFGLPIPRGLVGVYHFIRADLFKAAGVSTAPKGYDELFDATKALTDPKRRRWAFATIQQARDLLGRVNAEPNVWSNEGGTFTHRYETDAFKQSVNDMIEMWKAGVLHPDAFNPAQPFKDLFAAGTVAINASDGYQGWNAYQQNGAKVDGFELGVLPVYTRDGAKSAPWALGSGSFGTAAITKADPERIKLCLRMANYLAAPFGTAEYSYLSYGQEGVDHSVDSQGNPVLTEQGQVNTAVQSRYLGDCPKSIYTPGRPQDAEVQHDYQSVAIKTGIQNPAVGLFSNTNAGKNAVADKNFIDGVNDVVQGRSPFSALDSLIQKWRQAAGDGMRTEYQDQLQAGTAPR